MPVGWNKEAGVLRHTYLGALIDQTRRVVPTFQKINI